MTFRSAIVISSLVLLAGCNTSSQSAPSLSATPTETPAPAKPGFLEQATDATWRVVTAPAKLLPQKAAPAAPPQTYEAPSAIIVRRDWADPSPTTQPAHP